MSSAKWRPFCLCLNVLNTTSVVDTVPGYGLNHLDGNKINDIISNYSQIITIQWNYLKLLSNDNNSMK